MKKQISLFLVLALLLMSAGFAENAPKRTDRDYTLRVGLSTRVSGNFFTDLWGSNTADMDVRNLLHGLCTVEWEDETEYRINPTAVREKRTQTNPDGSKTIYITLNQGLEYSDGSGITAEDYIFTVLLLASPQMKELGAAETSYTYLKGYDAYHTGETDAFEGVRLLGNYMFSLTVAAEYLPFFYEDSYAAVIPYPISVLLGDFVVTDSEDGARIEAASVNTTTVSADGRTVLSEGEGFTSELLSERIFGAGGYMTAPSVVSGPYRLTAYDAADGTVEFEINPRFAGDADGNKPSIERIVLYYSDPDTAIDDLISGKLDLVNKCVSAEVIDAGLAAGSLDYASYDRRGMGYICFACEDEILSDVSVRRAICMALDRKDFIEGYLNGYGREVYGYYGIGQWMPRLAANGILPAGMSEEAEAEWSSERLEDLNTTPYNPAEAMRLLEEAGWDLAEDGTKYESGIRYGESNGERTRLTLIFAKASESRGAEALLEKLIPALEQIGVELLVEEVSFSDLLEDLYSAGNRKYDLYFLGSNFASVFDLTGVFSDNEVYENSVNISHLLDEELARRAWNMNRVPAGNTADYFLAWFAFQHRFCELMPMMPLYSDVYVDFYVSDLENYNIYPYESWAKAIVPAKLNRTEAGN